MSLLLALLGGAGGPVTATLTQTEQNDSLTSAAVLAIQAALTATEANDTLSATATLAIQATLTATEANDSLSSSAVLAIQASLTATEANDILSSTATVGTAAITADLTATEADDTLASTATISQPVPDFQLGANDRHWLRGRAKLRRVPTAEEVYRQAVNPPPPPLLDAPELAAIPDAVDREIAYRMRAAEAGRLANQVARALVREKLEAEFKAAQAQQEEDDAIMAIMTMVLMEAA